MTVGERCFPRFHRAFCVVGSLSLISMKIRSITWRSAQGKREGATENFLEAALYSAYTGSNGRHGGNNRHCHSTQNMRFLLLPWQLSDMAVAEQDFQKWVPLTYIWFLQTENCNCTLGNVCRHVYNVEETYSSLKRGIVPMPLQNGILCLKEISWRRRPVGLNFVYPYYQKNRGVLLQFTDQYGHPTFHID